MIRKCREVLQRAAFLVIFLAVSASGQTPAADSCREFVAHFYAWYVPFTQKNLDFPAFKTAITKKAEEFAPELLRALQEDLAAQTRARGEIVGIDFDPLVGSQDPADRYAIRNAIVKNGSCFVEIWRNSPRDMAARQDAPEAIAELKQKNNGWQISNVHYPELKTDLVAELATLANERTEKHH